MGNEGSITQCIHDLANGVRREAAVHDLWQRFYGDLTRYALRKLKSMNANCQVADEDDAATEAFRKVLHWIETKQMKLQSREDLRRLLLFHTAKQAITLYRRGHHGPGEIPCDPDLEECKTFATALQAIEEEVVRSFLDSLNLELRTITEWRLMGHTNNEIAEQLKCSRATVERKFGQVRDKWDRFRGE